MPLYPPSLSRGVDRGVSVPAGLLARESSSGPPSRSQRSVAFGPSSSLTAAGPRGICTPLPYQALAGTGGQIFKFAPFITTRQPSITRTESPLAFKTLLTRATRRRQKCPIYDARLFSAGVNIVVASVSSRRFRTEILFGGPFSFGVQSNDCDWIPVSCLPGPTTGILLPGLLVNLFSFAQFSGLLPIVEGHGN